jgi:hypothetical protein
MAAWQHGATDSLNLIPELMMTEEPLARQLTALGSLLTEVDARLAKVPVAPVGLEALKKSVDDLRTSMWAILQAGHGITAPSRVQRLKLRRAIEGLRAIHAELEAGHRVARQPEHAELEQAARVVADRLAALQ